MKHKIISNSLVILARSHNPTLVSDYFLKDVGIISDIQEINPNNKLITPAVTQIQLISGITINLDADKLFIGGKEGKDPFELGMKYCKALPFIRATAIGINFDVQVLEFDFKKWFGRLQIKELEPNLIKYVKHLGHCLSNITVNKETDISSFIQFNFHYQVKNKPLKEVELDFIYEWEKNLKNTEEIISDMFD